MKKDYTHIALILDRSGSMNSVKSDTIGGFNEFLKKQKEEEGECTFSMVQFDNEHINVHTFLPIKDVPELNDETFVPRSLTALFDAIGTTITSTGEALAAMNEADRPEKVLIVILTDGLENASIEYKSQQIFDLIKVQTESYNWKFVYLGANQDAIAVGGSMGIPVGATMSFHPNARGMAGSYGSMSKIASKVRGASAQEYAANDVSSFDDEDREEQNKSQS